MSEDDVIRDAERIKALASLAEVIKDFYAALVSAGVDRDAAVKIVVNFVVAIWRQQ